MSLGREERAREAFGEALKGLEGAKMKDSKKEETKKELEDVIKKVREKNQSCRHLIKKFCICLGEIFSAFGR